MDFPLQILLSADQEIFTTVGKSSLATLSMDSSHLYIAGKLVRSFLKQECSQFTGMQIYMRNQRVGFFQENKPDWSVSIIVLMHQFISLSRLGLVSEF